MFYSEQLLSKTGPLARVWLASNVERKLSKAQILQSDINNSVNVIVDQGHAPMALRLSGQLMLGVVRIYGRKARYLLDDCNDALLKIRMTFKSTNNHDLPAQTTTTIDLNLPEMFTVDDLFPAMDFTFASTQQLSTQIERANEYEDDWTSSLNPQTQSLELQQEHEGAVVAGDDLILDLGEDVGMEETVISEQMGRGEETPRRDDTTALIHDDGMILDLGEDVAMPDPYDDDRTLQIPEQGDVAALAFGDDETLQLREAAAGRLASEAPDSPLTELDPDLEITPPPEEVVEEVAVQQRQQTRRVKPMVADRDTVLHSSELKAFAADRSKILKPLSFLPQDPILLALMRMQKNGDFVTNAMNDGRSRYWAPELQGLLSFEVVRRSGQLKRKRDSGIADLSEDERSDKSPRLDDPSEQMGELVLEDEGVQLADESAGRIEIPETHEPVDPGTPALGDIVPGEDEEGIFPVEGAFDETTMPLVHPADSGPISVSTRHAVHLLRETFGSAPTLSSASSQTRQSVLLQDLIPEGRTSKEDATKMFFETLVLATKDAIKVEQSDRAIGMPIRVRAKRGLWGAWAEPTESTEEGSGTQVQPPAASQMVEISA